MSVHSIKKLPASVQDARNAIRHKGWKHVEVARQLGVTPIHLSYVLTGRRESRRILTAISSLPSNPNPA